MKNIAIQVENLSKRYRIGRNRIDHTGRYPFLRTMAAPFHHLASSLRQPGPEETLWALRNISFEVKHGEVVGIVGRNGAGKSTMLKILSRITEPTLGKADLYGRVGSLLEVGTGFHPELTGRENIYLSGTILGMKKAEIDRKFDEIIAFSGLEKFLDTPVKRYSSGMNVRLGFSVAAHLEPEILLVDEILAVGDALFQKKCLGKMGDVAKQGRTILFVSHNMAAVSNLCTRSILIDKGEIVSIGNTEDVIDAYTNLFQTQSKRGFDEYQDREGNGALQFRELFIKNKDGKLVETVRCGENVSFELEFVTNEDIRRSEVNFSVAFFNILGQPLFLCRNDLQGTRFENIPSHGKVICNVPKLPLPPGEFRLNLHCEVNGMLADWIRDALIMTVLEGDYYGSGRLPPRSRGDLLVDHNWFLTTNDLSQSDVPAQTIG